MKQQKIEDTALVEDEPSKGVKRKAEEHNGADATEQKEEPPAKEAKSEQHASGVHACCLGLCIDCAQIAATPPTSVLTSLRQLAHLAGP